MLSGIGKGLGEALWAEISACAITLEFVALGSVIQDMLHPDVILIGESDQRCGDILTDLYRNVCENRPAICPDELRERGADQVSS